MAVAELTTISIDNNEFYAGSSDVDAKSIRHCLKKAFGVIDSVIMDGKFINIVLVAGADEVLKCLLSDFGFASAVVKELM